VIASQYPHLFVDVRGWGLINGLEINSESELVSSTIVNAALAEGLLIAPAGPKVLRFVPPLIVSEAEVDEAMDKLEVAIAKVV
jgi:acetylornithine aminotransferase